MEYWSWVVTAIGLIGFWLAGKKVWWCWYINIANQALWASFALLTAQYGFLIGAGFYTFVFTKNAVAWTKEHRQKKNFDNARQGLLSSGVLSPNEAREVQGIVTLEDLDIDYNTAAFMIEGGIYHTYDPKCPIGCCGQFEDCSYR